MEKDHEEKQNLEPIAQNIAGRLNRGKISLEEAHQECLSIECKREDYQYRFDESRMYSRYDIDIMHDLVSEIIGKRFIQECNRLELAELWIYLGKFMELEYFETGDDDEGYRWTRESQIEIILDGAIGKDSKVYFVGHRGARDYVISPCFVENREWVDGGIVTRILCSGVQISPNLIFKVTENYISGHNCPGPEVSIYPSLREETDGKREPGQTNHFLGQDYLRSKCMENLI